MEQIVALSANERTDVFNEAGTELGLSPFYVEKDFWVCWTLRVLFGNPEIGQYLTFRGGTSLSKGWQLIKRFSEDIDLAMDREWVDAELPDLGEQGINTAERDRRTRRLRQACRQMIRTRIVPLLEIEAERLGEKARVVVQNLDRARDPFVIEFYYPAGELTAPGGYGGAAVKIELSGRADDWPQEDRVITPYVANAFPKLGEESPLEIACVRPARTFWEKAALLHEQNIRPGDRVLAARQARHLYDLDRLWENMGADLGLDDLFEGVKRHRKAFFNYGWVDYDQLQPRDLNLIPPKDRIADWRADYRAMMPMFFETPPAFDKLIEAIHAIESKLHELG